MVKRPLKKEEELGEAALTDMKIYYKTMTRKKV